MPIITYAPIRGTDGKFKSITWKKLAKKTIRLQLIMLSVLMNIFFFHKLYDIRCQYDGQIHGYFMSGQECDNQYQNWLSSSLLPTKDPIDTKVAAELLNNPDLK